MPHAVSRLRDQRMARSKKPFLGRGVLLVRCERCRVNVDYCMCAWQPKVTADSAVCLLMHDTEPLKPTNTGWLIADVVPDTFAFGASRTQVDKKILALLADPQWQPYVVFPQEYAPTESVVHTVPHAELKVVGKRPLFVLLDGTWNEARKMFRKSAYLADLPVLSLQPMIFHITVYAAQPVKNICAPRKSLHYACTLLTMQPQLRPLSSGLRVLTGII